MKNNGRKLVISSHHRR